MVNKIVVGINIEDIIDFNSYATKDFVVNLLCNLK